MRDLSIDFGLLSSCLLRLHLQTIFAGYPSGRHNYSRRCYYVQQLHWFQCFGHLSSNLFLMLLLYLDGPAAMAPTAYIRGSYGSCLRAGNLAWKPGFFDLAGHSHSNIQEFASPNPTKSLTSRWPGYFKTHGEGSPLRNL